MILERFKLDGKVAVVTGASSGLGVAFAQGLAEAGADIAIGARRADKLDATKTLVEARGRRCVAMATDITVPEDCTALVAKTMADLGSVDILINNAGAASAVPARVRRQKRSEQWPRSTCSALTGWPRPAVG